MLAGVVASAVLAMSCPATPVQYGVHADAARETAPWIAAGPGRRRLVGHLYAYSEMLGDARVRTSPGFVLYAGRPAKIGWLPRSWRDDWGRYLTFEGRRLDGQGEFRQRFRRAVAPQFYPTGVNIPSAGCWRLTLRSGRRSEAVVVQAIEPPAERPCDLSRFGSDGVRATPLSSGIVAGWGRDWRTADGGALLYTGGKTPDGGNTKVLWRVERRYESSIKLLGRRLDGPETFEQTQPMAASEPGAFPSRVVVPTPGCWSLIVRTGHIGGVIVFRAVVP
jgi:hypothetical protein